MAEVLNIFVTCVVKAGHIPENLKTTVFLLTRGLKLNSGMTEDFLYYFQIELRKKKSYSKKESNAFKTYN